MRTAAITLITLFCLKAFSQQDEKILPKSLNYKQIESAEPREIVLPAFSAKEWASLDYNDEKNGHMPKYARCIDTDISPRNSGTWTVIPGLGRIWRVKITSKNALALVPLFDSLYLPEGATLHVYMPDREETFGAFTHGNTPEPRAFCSGIIHGETCILEYFEPIQETGNGIIHINKVGHAY
ncbi:MAG TPA: hypothetical protein VG603_12230, partial [Chitinophagales bacterium]|nr:hypothetical protein [Chitinophagales bacterium]